MSDAEILARAEQIKHQTKEKSRPLVVAFFTVLGLIVGTWIIVALSWFLFRDYPDGLVTLTRWGKVALLGQGGALCVQECVKIYCNKGDH